ncbi:MAG: DUF3467 domain-containing protein [Planctomycetia bacterium]|nr:DUF3467 domain-containing protein [Planctomycetia bacterium]
MAEQERKPDPASQRPTTEIQIDDSKVAALYANFCRVTGTPEELVVDFSLNAAPAEQLTGPIVLSQRIVLSFFTAKRLFQALGMSLQRHEQAFGPIETNVQKRVVPQQQPRPNS